MLPVLEVSVVDDVARLIMLQSEAMSSLFLFLLTLCDNLVVNPDCRC